MNAAHFELFYASTGICTDTRKIEEGCLFICIKGDNFDGNTFAKEALKQGASHVIVDDPNYLEKDEAMTLVDDSVKYLQALANHHRKKFNIPVIGITGSNGKTSSKELINAVLSKKYNVLATIGNLNNHLGVPFTLLRLTKEHDIAIIEMGANKFKDIEELCTIAEPNYGIITNIGKAHLEGLHSFEGVLKTKRELYESVENAQGTIVVNQDDHVLMSALPTGIKTFSYGTKQANVQGELLRLSPFVEMKWQTNDYVSEEIHTQMVGNYNFYNFLAAAAFGVIFNVPFDAISHAISEYSPTNNRSQVKKTANNTLILDCYNANPTSMRSALESFAMIQHPDKLFILGDMKELGEESQKEHEAIIQLAETLQLKGYVVGDYFSSIASPAILHHFTRTSELLEFISTSPVNNQLVLLKGSRSIGLEVVEASL